MMKFQQNPSFNRNNQKKLSFQLIILLGFVSLFGDITYEGARSIVGPYLAILGASATVVGLIAGIGEFIGYALRLISGYLADRTERYWLVTIIGYGLILSIPLLTFAGSWQLAAFLIILERVGKAVRTPARDVILSHATKQVGRGWGFGIHEALDQVGAIIGPLLFSITFLMKGSYKEGFTILWIPAILTLATIIGARTTVPSTEKLETHNRISDSHTKGEEEKRLPRSFWFYTFYISLSVVGFTNFQLISYHFKVQSVVSDAQIPIFYAIAMGVDALVALTIGKTYDKIGLISLITIPFLTLPIPLFAFSTSYNLALISVVLWGSVMGIHETIMRAAIADLTPIERRGLAYGIFNTVYGAFWFLGSAIIGHLYDLSISYLILFVVGMEIIAITIFFLVKKQILISK